MKKILFILLLIGAFNFASNAQRIYHSLSLALIP